MRALLVFCSVRSLSKIEFRASRRSGQKDATGARAPAASRKRVQRYGNFSDWQNFFKTFFHKNGKKGGIGQNHGEKEEKWDKVARQLGLQQLLFDEPEVHRR